MAKSEPNRDDRHSFEEQADLEDPDLSAVSVEPFANASDGGDRVRRWTKLCNRSPALWGLRLRRARRPRPPGHRLFGTTIPNHDGLVVPPEDARILRLR
jgi:hypothetical protein